MEMKKTRGSILTPDKTDFKTKAIIRNKEGHYIMINWNNPKRGCTLVNIYVPNIGASKYVKQILLDIKGETERNTVLVGDFNTTVTSMVRSS